MRKTLLATLLAGPLALAAGPLLAATAYVSNEKDNTLSVIDLAKQEVVQTLKVGMRPRGLALSHDNRLL